MNILTFDIEEWFHILDHDATKTEAEWSNFPTRIHRNIDRILNILDDHNQKATFFCLGWIAQNYPEVVIKINEAGHEIASHSDLHQLAYDQTAAAFATDLHTSLKVLSDLIGKQIDTYRIPGFSLTTKNQEWVFETLFDAGIRVDCSVFPASRGHGGLPQFPEEMPTCIQLDSGMLHEFPINTISFINRRLVFSGGGYFRLLPYPLIRRFMHNSNYVMTYFHPRDFDPDQPMIPNLSVIRRFKSYYGLAGCESKLRMLLNEFDFLTVGQANERVKWDEVPVVPI